MDIDWKFIGRLEGASVLQGYVPTNSAGKVIGHSGVTIATGIDLGQMNKDDLYKVLAQKVPFPAELYDRLEPYLMAQKGVAKDILKKNPLTITKEEADLLDHAKKKLVYNELSGYWNVDAEKKFVDLPREIQTVLFSLAWNFGTALKYDYPHTWSVFKKCAAEGKWDNAYIWLKNFPSKNKELIVRRREEADYIAPLTTLH